MDRRLHDRLPDLIGNPFRDEGAAFRLVFVTIGVFGLIALGSWISTWVGVAVVLAFALAVGTLVWRWRRASKAGAELGVSRLLLVGDAGRIDSGRARSLHAPAEVRIVDAGADVAAAVEEAMAEFGADEVVVLDRSIDPASFERLCSRFVVPVRRAAAEDYLPETASR